MNPSLRRRNSNWSYFDEYLGDERTMDLQEALALYSPGSGMPYFDAPDLRRALTATLTELAVAEQSDALRRDEES